MKTIFTTGQVAKICKVAPRQVSKWCDSGRLRHYRIPGKQERRIPREHLVAFLKEHGLPLDGLEDAVHVHLCFCSDALRHAVEKAAEGTAATVAASASGFELGIRCEAAEPDVVIIHSSHADGDVAGLACSLRQNYPLAHLIGIRDRCSGVGEWGEYMHEVYEDPVPEHVADRIRHVVQQKSVIA